MSTVNYKYTVEDHASLLVLVKQVGCHLQPKQFSRLFERVSKLTKVAIPSQPRNLSLRYDRNYTSENNAWGDFQAHRKVLGLICFAKCNNENEVAELRKLYEDIKQQYDGTVFDSRLVIFGIAPKDGKSCDAVAVSVSSETGEREKSEIRTSANNSAAASPQSQSQSQSQTQSQTHSQTQTQSPTSEDKENSNINTNKKNAQTLSPLHKKASSPVATQSLPNLRNGNGSKGGATNESSKDGQVLQYTDVDQCPDLELRMSEFAVSLFWVLESKRLDRSQEFLDRMPMLCTPFEKRDMIGLDTDSRMYRKRCQGRLRKHLADLCLLSGQQDEALLHYHTAVSTLRGANDWMWLAGALEGLCAVSVIIASTKKPSGAGAAGFARNLSFSVKRGTSAVKEAKSKPGMFSNTSVAGGGLGSPSQNGLDVDHPKSLPDDVLSWYREAVGHYSKFKAAGVVDMECCIKACRVLTHMQQYLDASEFLQCIVYISLPFNDAEKVQRYHTLSQLYADLGMHRKAAFFIRIAAMQCVTPGTPNPQWKECYYLLLQALDGYRLSLDPKDNPKDIPNGWPCCQLRVMNELIFAARRIGNNVIAMRHLQLLLDILFGQLGVEGRKEMATILDSYSSKTQGTTQALALENGIILPPVPFLSFPAVTAFKLMNQAPHLQPVKLRKGGVAIMENSGDNPFIYSPIDFSDNKVKDGSIMEFQWVEGDICEVELLVQNPLPFELEVSNFGLMTEGVAFESFPTSLTIPAESGVVPVKLSGQAKESGDLTVLGYTTLVLGCRSNCRLRDLPAIPENRYTLKVVPPLPCLSVSTSLPTASSFSSLPDNDSVVTSAAACVYAGQSCECLITLTNTSSVPIDVIEVDISSKLNSEFVSQVLVWTGENLQSQLPLQPHAQACFTVYINGCSTFLAPDKIVLPDSGGCNGVGMSRSGSVTSGGQWASAVAEVTSTDPSGAVVVDALLRLQYSGGEGLREKYCRHCCVAMNVEIQPAVLISRWDVIPTTSARECNLLLDLENASTETLDLLYSASGSGVKLPPKHCQRVSLQLTKCSPQPEPRPPCEKIDTARLTGDNTDSWMDPVREVLAEHIANFVDIHWKIPAIATEGRVSLDSIAWTAAHIEQLTTPPVTWRVWVNEVAHDEGADVITVQQGQPLNIRCSITNVAAGCVISQGELRLQCNQSLGDGSYTTDDDAASSSFSALHTQLACLGAQRKTFTKLCHGESVKHSCGYMFFTAGRHQVELFASGSLVPVPSPSSASSSPTKSSATTSSAASASSSSTSVIHQWPYIPQIVIDVVQQ